MLRFILPLTAALVAAGPALAEDGGRPFTIALTGPAERPNPGDPDGTGTASLQVNHGQEQVCYTVTFANIEAPLAAHIHRGGPEVAGPVLVPLTISADGTIGGCATVTRDLAKELIQNPERFYVNVHNAPFRSGAIRGQLAK